MAVWHISSRVATAALLALVALDIPLVGMALRSTHTSGIDTSPVSSAPASVDSTTAPASPSPTASLIAAKAPLQIMLVALDNQQAWRASAGSCSAGGASMATTVDGGKTWAKRNANLSRIVRVQPSDIRAAFVIGANSSCAAELKDTSDGGGSWIGGGYVGAAWFRDPSNPMVVRAPGPSSSQPCSSHAVLDLAVLKGGSARVLCADGLVRSTTDNGAVWSDVDTVDGAVALAVSTVNPAETYVARLGAQNCAGVQILRVRQLVVTACVKVTIPKDPGQIAMSLVKGGGWLAVGSRTMRSTDDLVTWRVP
jgi:hypothetical protein